MIRRTYKIEGFDCANCALNAEKHLNKHECVESAVLDFSSDRLHIVFKDKELSKEEIKAVIREVETDEISIDDLDNKNAKESIFTKELLFLSIRVVIAVAIIILSRTVFNQEQYFWVNFGIYTFGLILISYDVFWKVINHIIHLENPLDEYLLISLCALGAFLVSSLTKDFDTFMESLLVVILFQIGQVIEGIATNKSKKAITSAMNLRVEKAHKLVDGVIEEVSPKELEIDDLVVVTTGELIPLDGVIVSGEGMLDTSSLTGEFVPILVKENMEVCSGCLLKEGNVTVKVNKEYKDSTVNKINELIVNSGSKKTKADEFVSKFARWYTPIMFTVSVLTLIIGGLVSKDWVTWSILGLKMMVVGCPCAIVISVPLAYFASLGLASKKGIVIKGTNYLDRLNELKKVVTDKTGTLTKGEFEIVNSYYTSSKEELFEALYASEYLSNHPIGKAICKDMKNDEIIKKCSNFKTIIGYGNEVNYDGHLILSGNSKLLKERGINFKETDEVGTIVYVSKDNKYLGYVVLSDVIKEDASLMINGLRKRKIDTILLTGDKEENTKVLANALSINNYHSELLPEDKITYLEKELSKDYATLYLGDGINDAASIKEADIGVAMGSIGSDVAVESADIVIMSDRPSKVLEMVKIARIARRTAIFNIIFALLIKLTIEVLAVTMSLLSRPEVIPMWLAVLADTGLTVILVVNSLLILYRKVDNK